MLPKAQEKCISCDKSVGSDDFISCFVCKQKVHKVTACSDLTRSDVQSIQFKKNKLLFLCNNCSISDDTLNMSALVFSLSNEIKELKKELQKFSTHTCSTGGLNDIILQDNLIKEIEDRNVRKNNLILLNIPESDSLTTEDRKNHDRQQIENIVSLADVTDFSLVTFFRLGKPISNKIRPIKVIFENKTTSFMVFKNRSKVFQDPKYKNIKIFKDSTPMEREILKKLRLDLEERKSNGEKDLTIKYIKGHPTIVKAKN